MTDNVVVGIEREFEYRPSKLEMAFEEELRSAGCTLPVPIIETVDSRKSEPSHHDLPWIGPNVLIAPNFKVRVRSRDDAVKLRCTEYMSRVPGKGPDDEADEELRCRFAYGRYCLSKEFKIFTDMDTFIRRLSNPRMYADLFDLQAGGIDIIIENSKDGFSADGIENMRPSELADAINLYYEDREVQKVEETEVSDLNLPQIRGTLMKRGRIVCSNEDVLRMLTRYLAQKALE